MLPLSENSQSSRPGRMPANCGKRGGFLMRFARDEDGVLVVFGVYVFLLILMIGGIGIDLMRVERDRSQLQYTLDRALLAAADLDQTLEAQLVVDDYFEKAGLAAFTPEVVVSEGLGFKVVSGTATAQVKTQFMHMMGVDSMSAPATSTAEERIEGVEISLVLDVSGSMGLDNRLPRLKTAAHAFIDEMVANTEDGKLSISIIPYATQVTASEDFLNEFAVTQEHTYSNCVNFDSADFQTTAISTTQSLKRAVHFDPNNSWGHNGKKDGRTDYYNGPRLVTDVVCATEKSREMMIMQKNATTLKNFISGLSAGGYTSIDLGMKWAAALLDPSLQPVVDGMITANLVDNQFSALPHSYNNSQALKVIVLMTDGENTEQRYMLDDYRSGPSNVYWNAEAKQYSILQPDGDQNPDNDRYFWPDDGQPEGGDGAWHDHPFGNDRTYDVSVCNGSLWHGHCYSGSHLEERQEPGAVAVLHYQDLWAYTPLVVNASRNYAPWMGSYAATNTWVDNVHDVVGPSLKDARTRSICAATKEQQVIVFTIAFEAPSAGVAVLKDCASSTNHFFHVGGDETSDTDGKNLDITEAFESIASSIRKLRLTQ